MKSSIIFETERLHVRSLDLNDNDAFFDLKNNPKVMNPLPRKVLNKIESDQELIMLIESTKSTNKKVWSICVKHNNELIGCCGFMKNDQNNDEIGYQLRELYWGKGFGTEIDRGLIEYGFRI
ncbi:MAG: GNAT family N-acetyltransferase [Fluviicola sp.]|jgi:ribosomal-protein-alanine N-acetyltransferase|nr:GNAT family N-acetyltransferase [Fluviicola sp.]